MAWEVLEFTVKDSNVDKTAASLKSEVCDLVENMDFWSGTARALSQADGFMVPVGTPLAIQYFEAVGARRLAYCTAAGVRVWDGQTDANVMPATGLTASGLWDTDVFGSWLVLTNDIAGEAPHAMLPSGSVLAPIPGWVAGWDCKFIRTHRNVLFAADLVESGQSYPNRVRWSTSSIQGGLPQAWALAPGNDAGMVDLELAGGSILGMCAVGDSMWIGGPGGIWVARWQGGAYVYQFSQRSNNVGMRGYRCMVSLGDGVAVLSRNDLVLMDDQSERSILNGRYLTIFRHMEAAQLLYIEATRELYLIYSMAGEQGYTRALIWDRDTDSIGTRIFDVPYTAFARGLRLVVEDSRLWSSQAQSWQETAGAWEAPNLDSWVYMAGRAGAIAVPGGARWNWKLSRSMMPGPDGENIRLRSFEVDIDGPIGQRVWLRVGSAQYPGESVSWGPERSYQLGAGNVRHDDIVKGRYVAWSVRGTGQARITAQRLYYRVNEAKP